MRQQNYLISTLRDTPAEAEVISHQLMIRSGLINQLASGIYTYLPLGYRVLRKVQDIVRDELNKAGAQEILMPAVQPAELWKESGRWNIYGPELMRLTDRHNREFALGPTHEEVVTTLLRNLVKSYKQLPINVYQIQTKFRDERRPRFGVLRSREFMMKDAYSFDTTQEGLDTSYKKMFDAYTAIFSRCGLNFRAVEADPGAIGGTGTHEFMVLSDIGEDTIAYCDTCHYAANIEKAEVAGRHYDHVGEIAAVVEMFTPDIRTIDQLVQFLNIEAKQIIKTVALLADGQVVLALVRGDYELNELKLKNIIGADTVEMLSEDMIVNDLRFVPGFLGPIGLEGVRIVADYSIQGMKNTIVGANKKDTHILNAQPERDYKVEGYYDLRNIEQGDSCPRCSGNVLFARGIEVGHVFKLGKKYSEIMGAAYLDEHGKEQHMIMGCYGIGISRTVAAIVEQNHDQDGIIWPSSVAPFQIHLIAVNIHDDEQRELSEKVYEMLQGKGLEVLFDDRNERPGVKFKDSDLMGLPIRITVGKKASEQVVECKVRRTGEMFEVEANKLSDFIQKLILQ